MKTQVLISSFDGLPLSVAISEPTCEPKGIVQISHGMAEHKERYFLFMEFLSENGYVCVIHDHRGHGESVREENDLGYFYTEDISGIAEDLHEVSVSITNQYPNLPLYLFSHSMGTLVARNYLKKYDNLISKLVLCGPPTENKSDNVGLFLAKHSGKKADKVPNHFLNNLAFKNFNKDYATPNGWLSENPCNVSIYNNDPLCGFTFTTNGFINLFTLQKEAFNVDNWHVHNPSLPILIIAGEKDPVIISENKVQKLALFLQHVGYNHVHYRLYPNKRHELLNEANFYKVFSFVLSFFNSELMF